jgi:uncharacterized protein
MNITPFYASLLAFLFVFLSVRAIRLRRNLKIPNGHGSNNDLLRATGAQANFAEYTPFALFLIFLLESKTGNAVLIHILGSAFVLGRVSHTFSHFQKNENFKFRVFGMALTFSVLISSSLNLIISFFKN